MPPRGAGTSRAAADFLAPFPSDSDTHLVLARLQFLEFKAHRCDVAILRKAFSDRATPKQRRLIVSRVEFAFLGETGRELTASWVLAHHLCVLGRGGRLERDASRHSLVLSRPYAGTWFQTTNSWR